MEDNKDLIPDAEVDNTKSQEVVANATTEEVSVKENDVEVVKTADKEEVKVKKTKKAKEPMHNINNLSSNALSYEHYTYDP